MSIRNLDQKNSSQQQAKSAEMYTVIFWMMIRLAHERAGDDTDNRHRFIQEEVLKLSVPDALEFNRLFEKELSRSYSWKLADTAELIIGGINDGLSGKIRFLHFRIALMSIGREVYDTVLESILRAFLFFISSFRTSECTDSNSKTLHGIYVPPVECQDVSYDEALQGVKLRAAMLNADAVVNTFCQKNSDTDWINNCWAAVKCIGDAIKYK
jgi:hypothetical protein